MARDLSQANDSARLCRTWGGMAEKEAFPIGKFYLKGKQLQRKEG